MSEEMRLPDDLAACEARLAAFELPSAGIDRDALLYQAGWAAAMSHLGVVEKLDPLTVEAGSRRRRAGAGKTGLTTAAWSLASAAVAASIAVVATLQLRPPRVVEVAAPVEAPRVAMASPPEASAVHEGSAQNIRLAPSRTSFNSGLIALRQRALSDALAEPTRRAAATDEDEVVAEAKSARELLQEMLPSPRPRQPVIWPWRWHDAGEST